MHEIVIIQWKLMHKQTKIVKIIKKGCINKHEIVTKVFWKKKKIKKKEEKTARIEIKICLKNTNKNMEKNKNKTQEKCHYEKFIF